MIETTRQSPRPRRCGRSVCAAVSARSAFTLVEVLLAILILVMLATVLVPSFAGMERRRAMLGLDELESLMSTYAYRDSLGGQPIALWRDAETGAIMLLVLERDESDPEAFAEWVADRFSQPVHLPEELEIVDVYLDRRREHSFDWILTRVPGQPRPSLEIDLVGPDDLTVTMLITPTSLSATRIVGGQRNMAIRRAIDLDAIGAERERW